MASHDDKEQAAALKQATRWAELDEADINETIQRLLLEEKGQKFLWWLLQIGKVGLQPFQLDPHATAFSCGELNVGNQIQARVIEVNPLGFAQMQIDRMNESDRRSSSQSGSDSSSGNDLGAAESAD